MVRGPGQVDRFQLGEEIEIFVHLKNGTPHSHISIIISITPGKNDGDNDEMKEIIEYSTKNDFRYLEKSEVIF